MTIPLPEVAVEDRSAVNTVQSQTLVLKNRRHSLGVLDNARERAKLCFVRALRVLESLSNLSVLTVKGQVAPPSLNVQRAIDELLLAKRGRVRFVLSK